MSADIVTQSIDDFDAEVIERAKARLQSAETAIYSHPGKNAAFRVWRRKLRRGERLPRGRFFKGKRAGMTMIVDEGWALSKVTL